MTDIETDTKTFSITIMEHPNVEILNFNAPTVGWIGEDFSVTYDAKNNGGEDTCFGVIIDETTQQELDRWEETIVAGGTKSCTHTLNISNTGQKNLILKVGYIG